MLIKKGDIVKSLKKDYNYLVLKITDDNKLIALKVKINESWGGNWKFKYSDGCNEIYVNYQKLCILDINNVEKLPIKIYNSYQLVSQAYDMRSKNLDAINKENREKIRKKKQKQAEINGMAKKCNKKVNKPSPIEKRPGLHDPIYKGHITIVRG